MLKVSNLTLGYGKGNVINDISFVCNQGEKIAILGKNGVGKTTLVKGIMGVIKATSGSVFVNDIDVTNKTPSFHNKCKIAFVPQGRGIFLEYTVLENLSMGGYGSIKSKDKLNEKVLEILEIFPELKSYLHKKGGVLSGGQQQLLAIARAIMSDPEVLILDEPTEGIQPSLVEKIAETLNFLSVKRNISIIVIEQNIQFVEDLTDKFIVIQKGKIATSGITKSDDFYKIDDYLKI